MWYEKGKILRNLVIKYRDIDKLFYIFKNVKNWEVREDDLDGSKKIIFKGYKNEIHFSYPEKTGLEDCKYYKYCKERTDYIIHSTSINPQDTNVINKKENNNNYNLKLGEDVLMKLYKDLYYTFKLLTENEGENEHKGKYDEDFGIYISLTENDLENIKY